MAITSALVTTQGAGQHQVGASSAWNMPGRPAPTTSNAAKRSAPASGCALTTGFAVSLAVGSSGSATPTGALQSFLDKPFSQGYVIPEERWHLEIQSTTDVSFVAGSASVTATRLEDGTWIVVSGEACD